MRRINFTFVLAIALLAPAMHAQIVSVYATFSPAHVSNVASGVIIANGGFQTQTASFWAPGIGGGVTLNFLHLGPATLGFDFRGSTKPGTVGADTALAGIKLGFHPPHLRFKPYVQGSAGYLASRSHLSFIDPPADPTATNKYIAYEVLGGLDYSLVHFVDLRLVEVGVGKGILTGINFGGSSNATLFTVNTGVVVHF
ncbi:MAG: hypothetical protein M3R43_00565 [Acidobacteriota bacterium]|nr:hypothetical protein [Acidobacteriota bacterium]